MTVEKIFEKLTKNISKSGIVAYFIHEKYSIKLIFKKINSSF
jgi:hypothetical protein